MIFYFNGPVRVRIRRQLDVLFWSCVYSLQVQLRSFSLNDCNLSIVQGDVVGGLATESADFRSDERAALVDADYKRGTIASLEKPNPKQTS